MSISASPVVSLTRLCKRSVMPPLQDCPACGKPELKKKISAAGFRLKGGGWYETDFKTGNKKNLAGGADGASAGTDKAGGDKKSSGSSESKSSASA